MNKSNKINDVITILKLIWEKQPDIRFNQLIHNLQHDYANKVQRYLTELYEMEDHNRIKSFRKVNIVDLFDVKDDDFYEFLVQKLDEIN